jgi:GNAT superfamily N-acetyltransferase
MEIVEFAPDDRAAVRDYVAVANAVRAADSPFEHPMTERDAAGILRYGWDLDPVLPYLLRVDGEAVALGEYDVSRRDNFHLAWLTVQVHPEHRRRGHGSALLDALVARARTEGRTSVGLDGWESAATTGFAARHGFDLKQVEVARRQVVAELDWPRLDKLYDEALPHAAAYELVRSAGMTPEQDLEAVAAMVAAINDAPTGDLDVEDEVFTPQRVRDYDEAQRGRGHRVHTVFARHRATGDLAGQTTVAVDGERPPAGPAAQGRDAALAARGRAPARVDRHLERGGERLHDRRQRGAGPAGPRSGAGLPAVGLTGVCAPGRSSGSVSVSRSSSRTLPGSWFAANDQMVVSCAEPGSRTAVSPATWKWPWASSRGLTPATALVIFSMPSSA